MTWEDDNELLVGKGFEVGGYGVF